MKLVFALLAIASLKIFSATLAPIRNSELFKATQAGQKPKASFKQNLDFLDFQKKKVFRKHARKEAKANSKGVKIEIDENL